MPERSRFNASPRTIAATVLYAIVYSGSLAWLSRAPGFEAGESVGVLLVFGVIFSAIAWFVTRGITPPEAPVRAPGREMLATVAYLALFAVVVLGWLFTVLKTGMPHGRTRDTVELVVKLVTMVALPAWLFTRLGYTWRELLGIARFDGRLWRAFVIVALLLLGLQVTVGRGYREIMLLSQPGWLVMLLAPLALLWNTLEAGLTEEFLFRVLLQTRAAAWLRSETAGIIAMSVLFGLAHAPGYVLRGAHLAEGMTTAPDPLTAVAYAIAVVSPLGLMFGVLWTRTRSLLLVVLLHGWADLWPNLADFVRTWTS